MMALPASSIHVLAGGFSRKIKKLNVNYWTLSCARRSMDAASGGMNFALTGCASTAN